MPTSLKFTLSTVVMMTLCLTNINMTFSLTMGYMEFYLATLYSAFILLFIFVVKQKLLLRSVDGIIKAFVWWIIFELMLVILMVFFKDISLLCLLDELIVFMLPLIVCIIFKYYSNYWRGIYLTLITIGNLVAIQAIIYTFIYSLAISYLGWGDNKFGEGLARADTTIGAATSSSVFLFSTVVICLLLISKKLSMPVRNYVIFSLIFILFGQLVLQTRSGLMMSGIVLFSFLMQEKNKKYRKYFIIAFIMVLIYLIYYQSELISEFIGRLNQTDSYTANSDDLRRELFENGIRKFLDNPIFGGGFGQGLGRIHDIRELRDVMYNPHNQYLAFGIDFGIIGLLIVLLIIFRMLKHYYSRTKNRLLVIAFLCMLLISFNTESMFTSELRTCIAVWNILFAIAIEKQQYLRKQIYE